MVLSLNDIISQIPLLHYQVGNDISLINTIDALIVLVDVLWIRRYAGSFDSQLLYRRHLTLINRETGQCGQQTPQKWISSAYSFSIIAGFSWTGTLKRLLFQSGPSVYIITRLAIKQSCFVCRPKSLSRPLLEKVRPCISDSFTLLLSWHFSGTYRNASQNAKPMAGRNGT